MTASKVKHIFMIGIGGSDLAAKAVWSALTLHKPDTGKRIFFLESPNAREYQEVENFVNNQIADLEEVALVVVSKSGETAETLEAFHKTFDILSEKFGAPISQKTLVISTKDSPLWKLAEQKNIECLEWEDDIGGRWSAFTVAHTEVLKIAGVDIQRFKDSKIQRFEEEAKKLAGEIFQNYKNGAKILDLFFFNSELEDLGKWCRQLIAESLGKENKRRERVGLTPTVSIGPVDLHSMLQLDLGGPKDKFTIFVISKKEANEIANSAFQKTIKAYENAGLPFEKYEISEINEYELGKFMNFMMAVTLELAKLLDVDPYDQPEVDAYKHQILNSK